MALSITELKKQKKSSLEKLNQKLQELSAPTYQDDSSKYWKPEVDKAGNGFATIRFLPAPKGEDIPFVRYWMHSFKGPTGQYYIENSLTTLNKADPVAELNSRLWNSSDSDSSPERKQAREQKRKLVYVANILVVQDPAHPENNGKVFLFKFGKKIFDKLNDAMNPSFQDEEPLNPFDPWDGANFKLKIRNVEGYRNYDKSEFDKPSMVAEKDDELENIWSQCNSLEELVGPEKFKSYNDLKERLNRVLGITGDSALPDVVSDDPEPVKPVKAPKKLVTKATVPDDEDDNSDDVFAKIKALAKD